MLRSRQTLRKPRIDWRNRFARTTPIRVNCSSRQPCSHRYPRCRPQTGLRSPRRGAMWGIHDLQSATTMRLSFSKPSNSALDLISSILAIVLSLIVFCVSPYEVIPPIQDTEADYCNVCYSLPEPVVEIAEIIAVAAAAVAAHCGRQRSLTCCRMVHGISRGGAVLCGSYKGKLGRF